MTRYYIISWEIPSLGTRGRTYLALNAPLADLYLDVKKTILNHQTLAGASVTPEDVHFTYIFAKAA